MPCSVIIGHNPLDRNSWERHESVADFGQFLLEVFAAAYGGVWPSSAKIYHESVDAEHDITPTCEQGVELLRKLQGTVYVMVWPKDPVSLATTVATQLVIFAVTEIVRQILKPPDQHPAENRIVPVGSPNNTPGERKNTARINSRIPDIYGRVRSTPDLLMVPYITYENNLQQETSFMCVGVGSFTVDEDLIFEGDTPVKYLADTSIQIYDPGDGPGDTPILTIGDTITDDLYVVVPVDNVKGDVLIAPNELAMYNDDTYLWKKDGVLEFDVDSDLWIATTTAIPATSAFNTPIQYSYEGGSNGKFIVTCSNKGKRSDDTIIQNVGPDYVTDRFQVGTKFGMEWSTHGITIDRRGLTDGVGTAPDLQLRPETIDDDCYEVTAVTIDEFVGFDLVSVDFTIPAVVLAEWVLISTYNPGGLGDAPADAVYNFSSIVYPVVPRIGPFFVNHADREFFRLNFVAEQGLWVDDNVTQREYPGGVQITVEMTPADENGNAIGPKETQSVTLDGSAVSRDFIGQTFDITPSFNGPALIACYRTKNTVNRHQSNGWESFHRNAGVSLRPWDDISQSVQFAGPFQDEVRWTHCYSMATSPLQSFTDVTTIHCKVKQKKAVNTSNVDRRLNLIVQRKVREYDEVENEMTPDLSVTRQPGRILIDILTKGSLGAIDEENIDLALIMNTEVDLRGQLGQTAINFDHTFDSDNASLEDLVASLGNSCFMQVFRSGDVFKVSPVMSTENATVLFNHRNKIPGSEVRSVIFNTDEEYDGVQISYHDDLKERITTFSLPAAGVALNPKILDLAGIHNKSKAMTHAWRAYYDILYTNKYVEFESCEEALIGISNDKILVANNVRTDTQDGDILAVDGLTLRTSQQLSIGASESTIFIQHIDGTTEAIAIASQDTPNTLTLAAAPSQTIFIDEDEGIYPRYIITRNTSMPSSDFRMVSREYKSPGVFKVTAKNYSEGVYFFDRISIWMVYQNVPAYIPIDAFTDRSPNETECVTTGSATITFDTERFKTVYLGSTVSDSIEVGTKIFTSYTIASWIYKTDTSAGFIFEDVGGTFNMHVEAATSRLRVRHGVTEYVVTIIDENEWIHVAATYNSDTNELYLYVNGELVDSETSVPLTGTTRNITLLRNFIGMADDTRLYLIDKSPAFIRTLYQKTRA